MHIGPTEIQQQREAVAANGRGDAREIAAQQVSASAFAGVQVAHALLLLIVLAALVLRLADLAALPLSNLEAGEALAVYRFWQGDSFAIGSPAYFSLSALLTPLLAAGDGTARLIGVFFGAATVALPWLLRARLGTLGALLCSLLLTLSPFLNLSARTAGGIPIAVFAGALLLIATLMLHEQPHEQRWLPIVGAALGIGLASDALFYTFLFSTAPIVLLQPDVRRRLWSMQLALPAALAFIGLSTLFLWQPGGLGAAADLLVDWFTNLNYSRRSLRVLLTLGGYEAIGIAAGVLGLVWLRQTSFGRMLAAVAAVALVLTALQSGVALNGVAVIIPLFLPAGYWLAQQLQTRYDWRIWLIATLLLMWGLMALVNLGRFTRLNNPLPFLIIAVTLSAVLFLAFVITPDLGKIGRGALLALLGFWIFVSWGRAWQLTHARANDSRTVWTFNGVDPDVRRLRQTLREASYQYSGGPTSIDIVTTVDTPALRWYLRDFENISWATTAQGASSDAVITSGDPQLAANYAAMAFDYQQSPELLQFASLQSWLRWHLFHEVSTQPIIERLTLLLRQD